VATFNPSKLVETYTSKEFSGESIIDFAAALKVSTSCMLIHINFISDEPSNIRIHPVPDIPNSAKPPAYMHLSTIKNRLVQNYPPAWQT
jgi:hypothetical protein